MCLIVFPGESVLWKFTDCKRKVDWAPCTSLLWRRAAPQSKTLKGKLKYFFRATLQWRKNVNFPFIWNLFFYLRKKWNYREQKKKTILTNINAFSGVHWKCVDTNKKYHVPQPWRQMQVQKKQGHKLKIHHPKAQIFQYSRCKNLKSIFLRFANTWKSNDQSEWNNFVLEWQKLWP